jgi:DnaA family protein
LSDEAQQALFDLINRQQMSCGLLVAAGDAAPRDLVLRRDLASRLGSGLVFQLHPLSDAEKAEALNAHARSRGFLLREEVIVYLLRHARRDMASLIQMLNALDQHSLETGREITLPLLKEISQPSLV